MAYTPTTWVTGDTVTATKMNKIENGIANAGGGGLIGYENAELDKNYNELMAMVESGTIPWIIDVFDDSPEIITRVVPLTYMHTDGNDYIVAFGCVDNGNNFYTLVFIASSATGTLVLD